VREAKLVEALAHGLYPYDRWDLLAELEKLHRCMARVEEESVTEETGEMGKSELPPLLEVVLPSSMNSSRIVCSDGGPLWLIPTNMTPKSFPSVERLRLWKRSSMNPRLPKRIL
jgi:hypothetical protein